MIIKIEGMKPIICTLIIFLSGGLYAQKNKKDCEFLSAATHTQVFQEFFYTQKYNANSLMIIDSLNLFDRCKIDSISGREVIFSQRAIKNDINTIHNYRLDILPKDKRRIYFWSIYTGGNLILTMQKKKDHFILFKYSMGAF
jgi:hypothetical protein